MKAFLSTTLVFASLMLTITEAQARTIYWTGKGPTPHAAFENGNAMVRRDCVVNKGVQHHVCYNAPITQVEDLGIESVYVGCDYYGNPIYRNQYVQRVYIYIP